jgi:hypothetical protein
MEKLDLVKKYKPYYTAKTKAQELVIEEAKFLSITGQGDPSEMEFTRNVQALYTVAYAVKFIFKARGNDFVVPKLEGLWWSDEKKYKGISMYETPVLVARKEWMYKLLLRIPETVKPSDISKAIEAVVAKKQLDLANSVQPYQLNEGRCVQILHVGPFDKEIETLRKLDQFMNKGNLKKNGQHHEIYLSDFRKTPPEKLRTILREPVKG